MLPYSSTKASSWEVKARSHTCSDSGESFEEGEEFISRLLIQPEGMIREDYKVSAWTKQKQAEALFYWRTHYRMPPPKKETAFKEENAEEALRQLIDEKDETKINTLFILAVLLERKRIFIERGVQRDAEGRQIRIYEHKETGESFLIPDPELDLEHIEEVQQEVALQLGWIKPGAEDEKDEESHGTDTVNDEENQTATARVGLK